jgi:hypothetical protein
LLNRLETVRSRAASVEEFHQQPPASRRDEDDIPYLRYVARPLAAAVLPGDPTPFVEQAGDALKFYTGQLELEGLDDPRLGPP